jgi:hypothetical protein
LVRILAVAQIQGPRRANIEERGQTQFFFLAHPRQPRANGPVISRRESESFLR